MASPNSTFTELVSTTFRNHANEVADNVSDHNALYRRLKDKNQIRSKKGGLTIALPLDYAENSSFQRFSGYDPLNIAASDVISAAEYSWVQAAVHVAASGRELRINGGREQIIDLAEARIKNARRTAANNMSVDLYSTGALTNQMGGLGHIITAAGTGTVGGINSGNDAFWANQFKEAAGTNTISKSTIKGEMMATYLLCKRGNDATDLIVSSNDFYTMYWESLSDLQRFASTEKATTGFGSIKFMDADVIHDTNSNFSTTAEKMYFLNTDYLYLVEHADARWTKMEDKVSVNQDAVVIPILWMGQLCCSNRSLQGVLIDAT